MMYELLIRAVFSTTVWLPVELPTVSQHVKPTKVRFAKKAALSGERSMLWLLVVAGSI